MSRTLWVKILQIISDKLNIRNWTTIDQTSCNKAEWWNYNTTDNNPQSIVQCNCSFENGSVCHVTSIKVKRFDLNGVLPEELGDLPELVEIDLTRNYINGTIPPRLGQLPKLKILSLIVNRLTGPIPPEIGNIATLEDLVLENNLLGGSLPPELGNLKSLERLLLSANNFTGTIPDTFGNLKSLTDFRIDGNELSGKIPEFIGNWTNMTILNLQGTSMEGPIPSTISLLKNLSNLRISDLKGSSPTFPDLKDMTNMKILILRNCSMTGSIPEDLGKMTVLDTLDLSFNKLTGTIPGILGSLTKIKFMFLNNNFLTGEVPAWILDSKENLDLSYNNFTGSADSAQLSCQQLPVNLVSSHVSTGNNKIPWCLNKDLVCTRKPQHHSLFINCGGNSETVGGNEYEDDATPGGAAEFASSERWGYSITGAYIGTDNGAYRATNSFVLNVTGFYQTARLAPQSLKYYGLCMLAGSYKVQLHFAEIMFSNNQSFSSLGRRIFDISIQVDNGGGLSVGAITGIVVASCVLATLLLLLLRKKGFLGGKDLEDKELRALDLQTGYFSLRQIKHATNNFDPANKIGEGGFGPVYKAPIVKRSAMNQDARFKAFELLSQDSQTHVSNESQSSQIQKSISIDSEFPFSKDEITNSSSSKLLEDLYDVNFD
ncbi:PROMASTIGOTE SURFACE ANTIGEN PROTEIN PSA [Salix koriyanagi]|uniref:non-specific serine/threonine protein kinase n=1 Tax=Salix koriyanagi TaxID=2511006 RepID=A0A9Q0X0F8_9ROSI|nr:PROMASTIGOTE SURFACE ANTIGEN PROTEIN PSA [Salix koriyanagi]